MRFLIDTNIAIYLRDGNSEMTIRLLDLGEAPLISLITLVELEGGVVAKSAEAAIRRERLDFMLADVDVLECDHAVVLAYRRIVERTGYSLEVWPAPGQ